MSANSVQTEKTLAENDKLIKSLQEKCSENLRSMTVLQDDLNYTQKCLSENADRLAIMEKQYNNVLSKVISI